MAAEADSNVEVIEQFYRLLESGDINGMRHCCTDDAVFWHCFDGVAQTLDDAARGWQVLVDGCPERRVSDATQVSIPGGVVERHLFAARPRSGDWRAWAVCSIIYLRGGLIARLDEYIDRAGLTLMPENGKTPGLPT